MHQILPVFPIFFFVPIGTRWGGHGATERAGTERAELEGRIL